MEAYNSTISTLAEIIFLDARNVPSQTPTFILPSTVTNTVGPDVTVDYNFTGSDQTFTVPAGVTSIRVTMRGAGGGNSSTGIFGGTSGFVAGTLAVTPGQTYTVIVGQQGSAAGGVTYGGGGTGYNGIPFNPSGGSGGGRSALQLAGVDVVTAGGGGGGGTRSPVEQGGNGGGLTGQDGLGDGGASLTAATGGTQVSGGTGGEYFGTFGGNGAQYTGGNDDGVYASGGGGGGWYGGGGGAGGAGGAGGSSYVANLTGTVINTQGGGNPPGFDGFVRIIYNEESFSYVNPGRKITIKDAYGSFSTKNVFISTPLNQYFEDGTNLLRLSTNFQSLQLFAASNIWYSIQSNAGGGFSQSTFTINCNAPTYVLDVNGVANISSLNYAKIQTPSSNLWVAVGADSTQNNRIKYSLNGIDWSNSSGVGFTSGGMNVAWNGKIWVAVGTDSTANNTIKYSSNGINWFNSSGSGFTTEGRGVAWNGLMWVATGQDSTQANRIKYSYDGITWLNSGSGSFTNWGNNVAWNGRIWVAVGSDGTQNNTIKYSSDGINWLNSLGSGFTSQGWGVAWNGSQWVAVGQDGTQNNTLKYSFDGITWLNSAGSGFTGGTPIGLAVGWNGSMWVAVGTGTNNIKYSFDGITWLNASNPFSTEGFGVSWNGSQWVAVGNDSTQNNRIKYSFDGINWINSSGTAFTGIGQGIANTSNQISYEQTNFKILSQNILNTSISTNTFHFEPSSMVINNVMIIDSINRNIGIRTLTPASNIMVDVNGPARGAFLYSTITAGGTYTISPNSNFGVFYNITANGTYTLSLPASQALSNVGKFFVLRNNSGSSLSITISGGTGIASPYTLSNLASIRVTVNATNSYTTL